MLKQNGKTCRIQRNNAKNAKHKNLQPRTPSQEQNQQGQNGGQIFGAVENVSTAKNKPSFDICVQMQNKYLKKVLKTARKASMIRRQCSTPTFPNQSDLYPVPAIGAVRCELTVITSTCRPNI